MSSQTLPHYLFDVGKRIDDWRLTAFIGRGGSGEVYRAQHTELAPPQLRPGVRFVPYSDSGAESTRKGAKWPKSGVFSGDKEVDPNF